MFRSLSSFACIVLMTLAWTDGNAAQAAARPNIVWVIVEDMSPHFGCYGETTIQTPHIDALAANGVKFTQAFITAPVCSAARSALVTGIYQTSIGAHQHRSGRGVEKIQLPPHVKLIPAMFREAGYYTCNLSKARLENPNSKRGRGLGKTDYNFEWDQSATYDGPDWTQRKADQPFFAQIHLSGGKGRTDKSPRPVKAEDVTLPPYYPRDPVILEDWARYLNAAINTDEMVGKIVRRLKDEGIADETYIFFITDHGISHARGKQFLYEEGIRIPLIVTGPDVKPGSVRDDLVVHIDLAAASLRLAGIPIPKHLEAQDILAEDYRPRDWIVSARDRCDETVERLRCVRTNRYKYIRNGYPKRPYLQPNAYKDHKEIIVAMRRLYAAGKLNRAQSLIMAETRPAEELYDLESDPHELHNLAGQAQHTATLADLRGKLDGWIKQTGDLGQQPESAAMFDSDMAVYLQAMKKKPERIGIIRRNIALMKQWAAEGR